jgi:basic amino acid/polyamine antiporter, APA family
VPKVSAVEWIAFVFSLFALYGCGPEAVLYGFVLLMYDHGLPRPTVRFYKWTAIVATSAGCGKKEPPPPPPPGEPP